MMEPILDVQGITKSFGANTVLNDIHFDIHPGEVHALIGENGAGKSTLIKIIGGLYQPDKGVIRINNNPVSFRTPIDSMQNGIAVIHQELSVAGNLSVAENIYIKREITNRFGFIDWKEIREKTKEIFHQIGIEIDPDVPVGNLNVGMQQIVEIAKAISLNSRVVLMDEPTSSLSEKEIAKLFDLIAVLKKKNVAIVYVSHKLNELLAISERITVLRDGQLIVTHKTQDIEQNDIINAMIGREPESIYPTRNNSQNNTQDDIILSCDKLGKYGFFHNVTFSLKKGEVLGFYGLIGSGRTEFVRTLTGIDQASTGTVTYKGTQISVKSPFEALKLGLGYLAEDRKELGLFLPYTVAKNLLLANPSLYTGQWGFIKKHKIEKEAREWIQKLDIRPPDSESAVSDLSGGNQQKVLLGKWLAADLSVLIVDEPTRGVDMGAKIAIYKELISLVNQGGSLIWVSSEMPEIMGISDTIAIFQEGKITDIFDNRKKDVTEAMIMNSAMRVEP